MADINVLLATAKTFMPAKYVSQMTDPQITTYLQLVVDDVNSVSPATSFTTDSMPSTWDNLICFGAQVYLNLFLVAKYSVEDLSYSDNGLSLNIDRTSKIMPVYLQSLAQYEKMKLNLKKAIAISTGAKALGTFQFTSVISNFLASIFPGTLQH